MSMPNRQTWQERREARNRAEAAALVLACVALLLAAHPWTVARTMAANPHWYSLRKNWACDEDFVFVVQFIPCWGYALRFPDPRKGWPYILTIEDVAGWRSWNFNDFAPNEDVIVDMGNS